MTKKITIVLFALCQLITIIKTTAGSEPSAGPGSLDRTFGLGTGYSIHFSGVANAVAIQPDNRIVAAGLITNRFGVARYTTDGSLDRSFGNNGHVTLSFGQNNNCACEAKAIALLENGSILVAGYAHSHFALARFSPNGVLDTSFGPEHYAGQITTSFGEHTISKANAMSIDRLGRIVLAGFVQKKEHHHSFALARYLPNGHLDTTFGDDGKVIYTFGDHDDKEQINGITTQGIITAAGVAVIDDIKRFVLAMFNDDGTLAINYGDKGRQIGNFPVNLEDTTIYPSSANAIINVNGGSRVVATGPTNTFLQPHSRKTSTLARYLINRELDTSFGPQINNQSRGYSLGPIAIQNTIQDIPYALAQYPNATLSVINSNRIVIVGEAKDFEGNKHLNIKRFNENGTYDDDFGSNATPGQTISNLHGEAKGIAIQTDGKIIAVGRSIHSSGTSSFLIARYNG